MCRVQNQGNLSPYTAGTEAAFCLARSSICEVDNEKKALRLVYRTAGKGTEEFSKMTAGETLEIMDRLGNGFPLERMREGKKAFLIGGGIGIPPMVELAKQLGGEKQIVVGSRDELFLTEELKKNGTLLWPQKMEAVEQREMYWSHP